MTTDPLRQAEAQLQRHWNVDGLHEIAVALISILTGLWVWTTDIADLPHAWKSAFSGAFPLLLLGGMFAAGQIIKQIRHRLTYPRAGFVEFRRPSWRFQIVMGALGACIAAGLALAIRRLPSEAMRHWVVLIPGIAGGVFLCQMGWRTGLSRFYILAGVLTAAALAIGTSSLSFAAGMVAFWLVAGAALLVSGCVTLHRFLHS